MRTVRFLLLVTLAVGLLALGFPRQAPAYGWGNHDLKFVSGSSIGPINDNFANALNMPPYSDERSTVGATLEAGEPLPCGSIGATVWYKWVPSVSDRWQASTGEHSSEASDFDTVLAVYTGASLATLSLVGCSDNASYLRSIVTFDAVAGQTYYFQVGGNLGKTGLLHLNVSDECAPWIPGDYNGTVTINGSPAPEGTLVRGAVQGFECATDTASGGHYAFVCPQVLPTHPTPGCFRTGWLSFEAGGNVCTPTMEWNLGSYDVNLQCPAADTDGDGFTDAREIYVSADPLDACPDVNGSPGLCPGLSCDGDYAWPPDLDIDAFVSIADVLKFKGKLGKNVGDPGYVIQLDLNGDGSVMISDVLKYKGIVGQRCTNPRIAFYSDRDGNGEIYVMNADGSGQTRLTSNPANDVAPSWSPDGSKIVFMSYRDGNWEIYVMNADGSGQTRLTDNPALDEDPAWSPDGARIAFSSDRDGNEEIYVMNANGSGQTNLTNHPADDVLPAWSPGSTRIAFDSLRDGNGGYIYVMNAEGSGQTRLTNNPAGDNWPAWSPDGSRIAFHSWRDMNEEIYLMFADGSDQTRLTYNPAYDGRPAWSPNGTRIAFSSDRDGNGEIYVMNADGSGQTNLTNNPALDEDPAWSP